MGYRPAKIFQLFPFQPISCIFMLSFQSILSLYSLNFYPFISKVGINLPSSLSRLKFYRNSTSLTYVFILFVSFKSILTYFLIILLKIKVKISQNKSQTIYSRPKFTENREILNMKGLTRDRPIYLYSKSIILNQMTTIYGSRTRKQVKNVQNFFREAGISADNQNIHDKNTIKQTTSKKDRVLLKKKIKLEEANKQEAKTALDKVQSDVSQESHKQTFLLQCPSNILTKASTQSTLALDKMIYKISILQVQEPKVVNGCYGHTTVVFKRPIIQGKYYLEFKMLKAHLGQGKAKIKSPPAIRLGICPPEYPKNTPLGQDMSIGYKGSNGNFVTHGIQSSGGDGIKEGDVIGMGMCFSPPHKYQDKEKLWQQSQIVFFKNGVFQAKWEKIYQCFYCPAFSLFNYASIEVRTDNNSFQHCPQGYNSYLSIFTESINYEPLKNTALFGQFKFEEN